MQEKSINRGVLVIIPKSQYYKWGNEIFPEDDDIDQFEECETYLVDNEMTFEDAEAFLKLHFDDFFAELLNGMCTDSDLWPQNRTWTMFNEWFAWHYSSLLWDLVPNKKIKTEQW